MLDGLRADIRQACRWLMRSPGFTLAAVASLAIAIGFNSALFSLVDTVLFRPLPVSAPESGPVRPADPIFQGSLGSAPP